MATTYCCCYPEMNQDGTRNCGETSNPDLCTVNGGTVTEGDCPLCFFVTELTRHLIGKRDPVVELAGRPALTVAFDFRYIILRQSALGREALKLYGRHAERAIYVLRQHPALLARALKLVALGIILAQDILRAYSLKSYGVAAGALQLKAETLDEGLDLARELGKLAPNEEFDHLIRLAEAIFSRVRGMTASQILDVLAVERPGTKP